MTYKEAIVHMTREAMDDLLRFARAVSDDRLTWRPAEHARSVLEILQECVAVPLMLRQLLLERPQQPIDVSGYFNSASQLKTVAECEQALRANTEQFLSAVQETPESDLHATLMFPWGAPASVARVMGGHYWNLTYHLGQIAYIQLLYGDTKMY